MSIMSNDVPCVWLCADLDLECLATWRDGSESYLYSRLTATTSAAVAADGDQYRCLVESPFCSFIVLLQ